MIATAGGGVAAVAATSSAPTTARQDAAPGTGHDGRAFGASGAMPEPAFALRSGDQVSVVKGSAGRCLIRTRDGRPSGETCATAEGADRGEGISVSDECGSTDRDLMEITGLAPEGTSEVALAWSNGAMTATSVVDGAFRFDATNPTAGEPYPVGVRWLGPNGSETGSAQLPVSSGHFCLPAE